ncbi:hypothetical protein EGW08_019440 [Elysia chlorotica]|uniref:Chitobiosyldiphosphodolichol beta-mannosyltransferase n=1 Tax=Elysia chlorotica TaxID=188477 RepID=A0A433SUF5_ELYCH|nr:hypothetical protein EGW08_019440 [Elysia chlorotica]
MSFSLDILFYTPFVFVFLYLLTNFLAKTPRNVCIVVLGDVGRSPRMQYHALSFAKEGFRVYLVGYRGSQPHEAILQNENIQLHHVKEPPAFLVYFPRLLQYILKVIWQSTMLLWTLLLLPKSSSLLIQNPPSIPTMLVSYVVCWLRRSELVIDWHNYGHTILSMALQPSHPLVKFSRWYEKKCARLSTYNICVTNAMKEDLEKNWNVRSVSVHDRPPDHFSPIEETRQHDFFFRLSKQYPVFGSSIKGCTKFTKMDSSGHVLKLLKRPALIVSSTSWTEDEDFSILLETLTEYDKSERCDDLTDIVCVITGKGPLKEFYRKKIQKQNWRKIEFCLPWLEPEDYPLLLASADLGVSLHTSSSGLDLPMKVVDMFGSGLPVCAANFKCIDELVKHNENGLVFNDNLELLEQLKTLLKGFPHNSKQLEIFRKNLLPFQQLRWHGQWKRLVLPIFQVIGGVETPSYTFPGLTRYPGWKGWGDAGTDCDPDSKKNQDGDVAMNDNDGCEAKYKKDR